MDHRWTAVAATIGLILIVRLRRAAHGSGGCRRGLTLRFVERLLRIVEKILKLPVPLASAVDAYKPAPPRP